MIDLTEKSAGWYYAAWQDSEMWSGMWSGPHPTREAAIQAGAAEAPEWDEFWICQAFTQPLDLARWAGLDCILERAEDAIYDSERINTEFEEGPFFSVTPEQEKDLEEHLRHAIHIWQMKHGLQFECRTFSDMRDFDKVGAKGEADL